jgi:hypothetical protein
LRIALDDEDRQLLFLGNLGRQRRLWPQAEHVVAMLPALEHSGSPLPEAVDRLQQTIQQAHELADAEPLPAPGKGRARSRRRTPRRQVVVRIGCAEAAIAVAEALEERGVHLRFVGLLAKLMGRRVSPPGPSDDDGADSGTSRRRSRGGILPTVVVELRGFRSRRKRPAYLIDVDVGVSALGVAPHPTAPADAVVRLGWYADMESLSTVVEACRPRRLSLIAVRPEMREKIQRQFRHLDDVQFLDRWQQLSFGF